MAMGSNHEAVTMHRNSEDYLLWIHNARTAVSTSRDHVDVNKSTPGSSDDGGAWRLHGVCSYRVTPRRRGSWTIVDCVYLHCSAPTRDEA